VDKPLLSNDNAEQQFSFLLVHKQTLLLHYSIINGEMACTC